MSSIVKHTVLSPVVTGTLLYILTRGPPSLRNPLVRRFSSSVQIARLITSLKWLFALGLGRQVNSLLSTWARNRWQWKSDKVAWKWNEEVAVVTGGSNGIGALIAKGLAMKGIKVAVIDVQSLPQDMENWASISYFKCDITSPTEVQEAAGSIRSSLGVPTILCNNAGIASAHTILDTSAEYLRKLFDVNLLSHFYLIQAFLPGMMEKKKGHIVSTASMASFVGVAGLVDYCATKAGVLALHEGLGQELKHRYNAPQIKTSVVHPIYVNTRLITSWRESLRTAKATLLEPETVADAVVAQIVSGRSGQIVLPAWMGPAAGVRGWPDWLQEIVRDGTSKDVEERAV